MFCEYVGRELDLYRESKKKQNHPLTLCFENNTFRDIRMSHSGVIRLYMYWILLYTKILYIVSISFMKYMYILSYDLLTMFFLTEAES